MSAFGERLLYPFVVILLRPFVVILLRPFGGRLLRPFGGRLLRPFGGRLLRPFVVSLSNHGRTTVAARPSFDFAPRQARRYAQDER
jgi:hypothetical protein